ncbi:MULTISPECIES: hydroxysqualene dehydroxylase HpnE [Comamonas]|uniref:hydroxysqualene dehydroxylase HpnE n=1 Tax=Comamonas TaxID=283 RepID=UPI00257AA271|nr:MULTISPECIES: hydroxysqualene dehydroxylase HpnE [Comamonas]
MASRTRLRIAIIGGGWAGMAAAASLQQQGHQLHIWEASRTWGGRARALTAQGPQGQHWTLDNGQHILIGAYSACLQAMRTVGVQPDQAMQRLPLDLRYADGTGLQLPHLPTPWDAVIGIARTRGWSWREKLALLRTAHRWQRQQFQCAANATVADICLGLPARLMQDFVDPLCISALNLPACAASGRIFLRVLQDGLFSGQGGSNLLIPRTDLSMLYPAAAAQWLQAQGAQLRLGVRATHLAWQADSATWHVDGQAFDAVVIATASTPAARLVQHAQVPAAVQMHTQSWAAAAHALPHTAIATVYAYTPPQQGRTLLPAPMVALRSHAGAPAQFAFDKGQLGGPAGVIALVVSASPDDKAQLQTQVLQQARAQLQLQHLQALQTVIDKRATFACTPLVQRPGMQIAPGLWACGDYVDGPYPATLEGAVRSGMQVAHALAQTAFAR